MTATALVTGKLFRAPECKTSAKGSTFATATLREGAGDGARWWRIAAFDPAVVETLLLHREGESIRVSGPLKAELYEKDGEKRLSLSLVVDGIISARRKPKADTRQDDQRRGERRLMPPV